MGVNHFTKHFNQKKEYKKRQLKHQEYQKQLTNYEEFIKRDFNFIKENITEFDKGKSSSMTCIQKQEFKKVKNRYYRNRDYCRYLRRKIKSNA